MKRYSRKLTILFSFALCPPKSSKYYSDAFKQLRTSSTKTFSFRSTMYYVNQSGVYLTCDSIRCRFQIQTEDPLLSRFRQLASHFVIHCIMVECCRWSNQQLSYLYCSGQGKVTGGFINVIFGSRIVCECVCSTV
uniref:PX domain-containing protein n=1 Tax=Mesocestoides corti TaxID=53468 RepID=A0A5K3F1T6_MESCO